MVINLNTGKWYEGEIFLSGTQCVAPNSLVVEKLKTIGFININVTGFGTQRKALGFWPKPYTTAELPPQVKNLKEL